MGEQRDSKGIILSITQMGSSVLICKENRDKYREERVSHRGGQKLAKVYDEI